MPPVQARKRLSGERLKLLLLFKDLDLVPQVLVETGWRVTTDITEISEPRLEKGQIHRRGRTSDLSENNPGPELGAEMSEKDFDGK